MSVKYFKFRTLDVTNRNITNLMKFEQYMRGDIFCRSAREQPYFYIYKN